MPALCLAALLQHQNCISESCNSCSTLQAWLQELTWTEADKPFKLAARSAMLPDDAKMQQQPMFCYETMLNLLYWSCLVYDHDRVRSSVL